MAVRSFMSIVEAHERVRTHAQRIREGEATVFQSRHHAPKQPSFNQRRPDLIVDPVPPAPPINTTVFSAITHPTLVGKIADKMVDAGLLTPQQRYNVAMQQDIG